MPRAVRIAGLLVVLLVSPAVSAAAGLLVPRGGGEPIAVESHRVTATITDGIARTKVRQTFVNRNPRTLEAVYLFPLPENAALVDVAMEVGGQRLEGLLAERKQARRVYDRIVRRNEDPALLEQVGRGKFRLSVFPVVPGKPTVVEITYLQHLPLSRGEFRYVYPLALGGGVATTLEDLTVSVTLRSSAPLAEVVADATDAEVLRKGPGEAIVSLERSVAKLDRDLVVTGKVEVKHATLSIRTWRPAKGNGYFMAVLTPPPLTADQLVPRDVVLVVDTSGSMAADGKIDQAKAAARHLIAGLRETDRVNILRFSSGVIPFADAPVPVTAGTRAKLERFVGEMTASGGTALGDALLQALALKPVAGRVRTIVLLSDGAPTIGITDPRQIVAIAAAGGEKGLAVYPFGVGSGVNAALLRGIARATGGRAEIFRPGGELETRVKAFLDRTNAPAIADVRLSVPRIRLYDTFPRRRTVAHLGEQVVICGRWDGAAHSVVTAKALVGDREMTVASNDHFPFPVPEYGDRVVADLFARMKLDFLEEEQAIRTGLGDEAYFAAIDRGAYSTRDEIIDEIIGVSLLHGVQSAYTAFLVLLPEDRARIDPRDMDEIVLALERARKARGPKPKAPPPPPKALPATGEDDFVDPLEEEIKPEIEDQRPVDQSEEVIEDPVIKDAKVSDHNETDNDLPFEETLGNDDFLSDGPFDGPSTNGAIGIGGGRGGAFGGRGGHRNLKAEGGGARTNSPVDRGLKWLADHQRDDGSWEGPRANTGLALLAFLGAGETHKHGRHKRKVKSGLRALKVWQDPEGCFADRTKPGWITEHAILTLAMSEAYSMTGSPLFRQSAQAGIDLLDKARVPNRAWGDGIRVEPCDPSTTTWAVMALSSGRRAGLRVPTEALESARSWLAGVADARTGRVTAKTGSACPPVTDDGVTAAVIFARLLLGDGKKIREHVDLNLIWPADGTVPDIGFVYFATLANFRVGGEAWKRGSSAVKKHVIDTQVMDPLDVKGSWTPRDVDGKALDRVAVTALSTMVSQVYCCGGRVFGMR